MSDHSSRVSVPDAPVGDVDGVVSRRDIPAATVGRLPLYLRALHDLSDAGQASVSSKQLAGAAGVNPAQLRKDLSYLGSHGTRGVGYDVVHLLEEISVVLGLGRDWSVIMVGAGHLGRALAGYGGLRARGFAIAALIDADPRLVGSEVSGLPVHGMAELPTLVAAHAVEIGIIATPAHAAQQVCDRLVAAGVASILNFAPRLLNVPEGVEVRKVDVAMELQILSFHEHRRRNDDDVPMLATSLAVDAVPRQPETSPEIASPAVSPEAVARPPLQRLADAGVAR